MRYNQSPFECLSTDWKSVVHCCAKVAGHLFLTIHIDILIYKIPKNEFFP